MWHIVYLLRLYNFTTYKYELNNHSGDDCILLSLPPEIRNKIYKLVFTFESDEFGFVKLRKRSEHGKVPSVLSLLQTCK
jgi:hypothetical protein